MTRPESPTRVGPVIAYQQGDGSYRTTEGISQSMLKEILVSPAHFRARYGPDPQPFYPSASMIQGSATHCLILEPEEFPRLYYNRAEKPKPLTIAEMRAELQAQGIDPPKSAKKADLELHLYPDGKPVDRRTGLDPETYSQVHSAADALRSHDITGSWFCPGQQNFRRFNEVSLYIRHELGLTLKGRLDRIQIEDDKVKILDLKTTVSARPQDFVRQVVNLNYDLQAAFYTNLAATCYRGMEVEFYFVVLERKSPHGINVFRATEEVLTSGRRKLEKGLTLLAQCMELDYWPGYEPTIHELRLPSWVDGCQNDSEDF